MKPQFLDYTLKLNFQQLKEQKDSLIRIIWDWENSDDENNVADAKLLLGVVGLIDEIQDQAVDVHGMEENEVFNFTEEDYGNK